MKRLPLILSALVMGCSLVTVTAAEGDQAPAQERRGGGRQGGGQGGERQGGRQGGERRMDPRAEAEAKIKAALPEEFKEVERLRAEANAKLQELAKKAGVEIPKTMEEQVAGLRAKYPKEFAEIDELAKTDRRAAFQKTRELAEKEGITLNFGMGNRQGGPGQGDRQPENAPEPPRRPAPMQQMRLLQQRFPEEMAKIAELRKTDPEAARVQTQELLKKLETPAK